MSRIRLRVFFQTRLSVLHEPHVPATHLPFAASPKAPSQVIALQSSILRSCPASLSNSTTSAGGSWLWFSSLHGGQTLLAPVSSAAAGGKAMRENLLSRDLKVLNEPSKFVQHLHRHVARSACLENANRN